MFIIGITGPSGAGKTTLLRALEEAGGYIEDCDAVYHSLLEEDADMLRELRARFPGAFKGGKLDRKAMGSIVFKDEKALAELNAITHGYVVRRLKLDIERESFAGRKLFGIDAIALIESGLGRLCGLKVAVVAEREIRISRLMERDGISREYAQMRVSAQKTDDFFERNCDAVLRNDGDLNGFRQQCAELIQKIKMEETDMSDIREQLFYTQKNAFELMDAEELKACFDYAESYKSFLGSARTEREAVKTAVELAEKNGFREYRFGEILKAGDRVYCNNRGKSLMLAVIGEQGIAQGANVAAAHIDSPRLDLKQLPLYEDNGMAFFKTHYYGGIKKYQWVTIPLLLIGTVVKRSGETVEICIGAEKDEPQFTITDLLPHLGADQMKKTLAEGITGEGLNILIASRPDGEEGDDRVKLAAMKILNEKYGITEEDFLSAEIEAVPAFEVRDLGLDRTMIGGYGHDDRVCAYAELKAIFDVKAPAKTAVCILADKEEIGSEGVSGMKSQAFENFINALCKAQGADVYSRFANSFCISADVCNALDPNFPEVSEKRNNAKLNYGMGICKFTGSRGKSGSNDASAEVVGKVRRMFSENGVVWQMAELGKVDQGGGGTVAKYMAERNIDTIDAGVPVLSMHAPYEVVSKADAYMTYKGILALYQEK